MSTETAGNDNAWPDDSLVHTKHWNGEWVETACARPIRISEYAFPAIFVAVAKDESKADPNVLRHHRREAGRLCRRCLETFDWSSEGITLNERQRLENLAEMAEMLAKQHSRHQHDAEDYSYVADWCARARAFRDKAAQCPHLSRVL